MKRAIWIIGSFFLAGLVTACGGTVELGEPLPAYTEGNFFAEEDITEEHVLGPHQNVLFKLELEDDHENDSGETGFDRLHYVWQKGGSHTICLTDAEGAGHYSIFYDDHGHEIFRLENPGDCRTLEIQAGSYYMDIHNGGDGESPEEEFVFVHPGLETPDPPTLASTDDPNARFKAACMPAAQVDCSAVKVGSFEGWASDYVGEPGYGEVVVISDNHSQYVSSGSGTQDHQNGPSNRAIKFNGPCVSLATQGINFDDSLVGIVVGKSTGVWLYVDEYFGGSNAWYYKNTSFIGDDFIPAHSVSSLHVMTYSQNHTQTVIDTKSCSGCDLTNAFLSYHNLTGAYLENADLTGARMEGTTLTNANLTNAKLIKARMSDAVLNGANLTGAKLNGANLSNTDLSNANLTGAFLNRDDTNNYSATILTDAFMVDATLKNAHLNYTTMTGVNFYTKSSGATAEGADLSGADLSNAILIGTSFNSATIDGTKFNNAVLINAKMHALTQHANSTYGTASFYQTLLAGADFTNTTLPGSDFSDAQISRSVHSVDVIVKVDRTHTQTNSYQTDVTIRSDSMLTLNSICPDRHSAPCNCEGYPEDVGCTKENRWTPVAPPTYIGNNDPNAW